MKICVIGGGWNGLYALKWLVEEGARNIVLYEKQPGIGGTWFYREGNGGVFQSTRTTASTQYLHASDFPFPTDKGNFPHHAVVQEWLQDYIRHFDLARHIQTRTLVTSLRKSGSQWEVQHVRVEDDGMTSSGGAPTSDLFDRVVVASGISIPTIPIREAPWNGFTGDHFHSSDYKKAAGDPRVEGKTVMVVGGGESASDVAVEIARVARRTVVSIRRGAWIYDREFGNGPFDVMTPRMIWCFGWSWYQSQLIRTYQFCLELMFGYGGSGIPDWKPDGPFMRSFFNKSRDIVREVAVGRILARRHVERVDGKQFWFQGRANEPPIHIDTIVWCTGFDHNFKFFEDNPNYNPTLSAYKLVFYADDPTLAFTGTARPIFGSFLGLCELQCRWIAKVFTGQLGLPTSADMKAEIELDRKWHRETFPCEERRPFIRCHFHYSDEIALKIDAKPHLFREFLRSPSTYMTIMLAPWNPFQYHLNDPARREVSLQRIRAIYPHTYIAYKQMVWGIYVHLVLFALLPLLLAYAVWTLVF